MTRLSQPWMEPELPSGPNTAKTAGNITNAYMQDRAIVTNKKDANLTKKALGAKNMKKAAIKVDSAPDKTETPISSTMMATRFSRVSPCASVYASLTVEKNNVA